MLSELLIRIHKVFVEHRPVFKMQILSIALIYCYSTMNAQVFDSLKMRSGSLSVGIDPISGNEMFLFIAGFSKGP